MKTFMVFDMAREYAERRAREKSERYYVAQDSRAWQERWMVGTEKQYLRTQVMLSAKYVALPEMPVSVKD